MSDWLEKQNELLYFTAGLLRYGEAKKFTTAYKSEIRDAVDVKDLSAKWEQYGPGLAQTGSDADGGRTARGRLS